MDGAGAIRIGGGDLLQGIIIPKAQSRALLAFLVPEIAALVDAIPQVGDGADGSVILGH